MVLTKEQINELLYSKEEIVKVCSKEPTVLDEIHKMFDIIIDNGQFILRNVESIFLEYKFVDELEDDNKEVVKETLWNMFTCSDEDFIAPSDFEELIE